MTNREKIMQMSVKEFYETDCKEHYENEEEKQRDSKGQFSDMSAFALFVCTMFDCHNCPEYSDDDFTVCDCNNLDKWLDEEATE